jgi:hypothetical protein
MPHQPSASAPPSPPPPWCPPAPCGGLRRPWSAVARPPACCPIDVQSPEGCWTTLRSRRHPLACWRRNTQNTICYLVITPIIGLNRRVQMLKTYLVVETYRPFVEAGGASPFFPPMARFGAVGLLPAARPDPVTEGMCGRVSASNMDARRSQSRTYPRGQWRGRAAWLEAPAAVLTPQASAHEPRPSLASA